MRLVVGAAVLAACLGSTEAHARLDETLDVSVHATRGRFAMSDPSLPPLDVHGLGARVGWTLTTLRFGGDAALHDLVGHASGGHPFMATGELFVAVLMDPGCLHPFVELRAHVDHVHAGDLGVTRLGLGPRVGVLVPLNDYFFLDLGFSMDLVGPETFRGAIGLGLPIPLSHL
ncbi:MAG: hypothetical protein JNL79_14805 [Myxococcales bacterium]|nr:hypothetical protein [Myxococcales bacterium]